MKYTNNKPKTIFCDIDGTLCKYPYSEDMKNYNFNKIKSAKNIEILSVSNLMGEAIRRISNSTSVSYLFK